MKREFRCGDIFNMLPVFEVRAFENVGEVKVKVRGVIRQGGVEEKEGTSRFSLRSL